MRFIINCFLVIIIVLACKSKHKNTEVEKISNDQFQKWLIDGVQEDKFKLYIKQGKYYSKNVNFEGVLMNFDSLSMWCVFYDVIKLHLIKVCFMYLCIT